MDQYTLELVTLTCPHCKEKLDKIPDPQRLSTVVTEGKVDQPDSYKTADVIFLPYALAKEKIGEILQKKAKYTYLILLKDESFPSAYEDLAENLLPYDVWDMDSPTVYHHISALKEKMRTSLDLEFKESQLYTMIDSIPDLIWYKDLKGAHIDVNDPFCRSIGMTKADIKSTIKYKNQGELMGLTQEEFENGDFACVTTDNYVIAHQDTSLFDEKVLIHGELRQFKTYKTAMKNRKGESIGTVGMAHDVTDIWNTHEEFRIVISRLPFPMIILDKTYALLSFNAQFGDLFHYNEENQDTFDISSFGEKYFEFDIKYQEEKSITVEKEMVDQGCISYYIIEKSEITDVFGELSGYFYIFRDVTKTHQYEEKLRMMAETDELTQINNRKAIRDFYETKIHILAREQASFSVTIIDIDFFKLYNDHYGHLEGDVAIKAIATILKSHGDNESVLVGRFGGEEFLVLTIGKTKAQVKELLESLQKDLKQGQIPHEKSKVNSHLTMSMGVHYLEKLDKEMKLVDLIEVADKHLYEAKEQGRNRFLGNL